MASRKAGPDRQWRAAAGKEDRVPHEHRSRLRGCSQAGDAMRGHVGQYGKPAGEHPAPRRCCGAAHVDSRAQRPSGDWPRAARRATQARLHRALRPTATATISCAQHRPEGCTTATGQWARNEHVPHRPQHTPRDHTATSGPDHDQSGVPTLLDQRETRLQAADQLGRHRNVRVLFAVPPSASDNVRAAIEGECPNP